MRTRRWAAALLLALVAVAQLGQVRTTLAQFQFQSRSGGLQHGQSDFHGLNDSGLSFMRTYNSLDATGSSLGPGWTHSFAMRLTHPDGAGPDDFLYVGPRGERELYTAQPDGSWQPSVTAQGTLKKTPSPAGELYVLTQPFETVYYFGLNGRPYRTTFANTWDLLLSYDGDGRLTMVTNRTTGALLRFAYSDDGSRLVSVADDLPRPRRVSFDYDQLGRLASVTNRVGAVTRYAYVGETHLLHEVVDSLGNVALTTEYGEGGQLARQWTARGLEEGVFTSFSRQVSPDGTVQVTTVEPPTSYAPSSPTTRLEVYDAQGRLTKRETGLGPGDEPLVELLGVTPYGHWNVVGHAGGKTPPPSAGGQPLSEVLIPGRAFPQPFKVGADEPMAAIGMENPSSQAGRELFALTSRATDQTVDRAGRIVGLVLPASGGQMAGAWRIAYDDDDKIVSISQRGAEERTTTFRYDALGSLVERLDPDGGTTRFVPGPDYTIVAVHEASGATRSFEWEERGLVARIVETAPDGSTTHAYEYLHDGLRRLRLFRDLTDPSVPREIELAYDGFTITGIWQR